jgi:hypothetical protein
MILFEEELINAKSVLLVQKTSWLECLPFCEQPNSYSITRTNIEFDIVGA